MIFSHDADAAEQKVRDPEIESTSSRPHLRVVK
jgi:hypothetical protein